MDHPHPPTFPESARMGPDTANDIRREVQQLLGNPRHRGFPGSQPVSFDRRSLEALKQRDFYVCEKSDGVRCLMYLTAEEGTETAYMWDRRDDFYQIQGHHFPRPEGRQLFFTDTLLDGELVNDRESDGSVVLRFVAFDCLVVDKKILLDRTLDKRLAYLKEQIHKPYKALFEEFPEELEHQPFQFRMKDMQFAYATEMMFREVLPNLKHGNDGLIFTCRETPYALGTDPNIIKWKPPSENSIDFKLRLEIPNFDPGDGEEPFPDFEAIPAMRLFIRGSGDQEFNVGDLHVTEEEWTNLKALDEPLDERIVEAYKDDMQRWRYMRFRDDKMNANHKSVYDSVVESIEDAIDVQHLIAIAGEVRRLTKARQQQKQQRPG